MFLKKAVLIFSCGLISCVMIGQSKLSKTVISNGGQEITGTDYKITLTLGQGVVAKTKTETTQACIGFWYVPDKKNIETTTKAKFKLDIGIQKNPIAKPINDLKVYPNPFYTEATAEFQVNTKGEVKLTLIDMQGNTILHLVDEVLTEGRYRVPLKALGLTNAMYTLILSTDRVRLHQKCLVLN